MNTKMKSAILALLVVDVTVLMAAPATQPAQTPQPMPIAKPAAVVASTQADTSYRDRQYRDSSRGQRRYRDRSNSPVNAAPVAGDPFAILDTRSIFMKGNQNISATPVQQSSSFGSSGSLARKPESSLVFNGVTIIDGQANAFIEDLTADRVSTVKVGDPIAGGKVSAISFDTMTYQGNGRTLNVTLGQNLEGNLAISTDMDSTAGAATTSPTTLPFANGYIGVGGSSGVITQGMSQEDILARMKAKRQAEMNGH